MMVNLFKLWILTGWLKHHAGNETAHCRAPQFEGRAAAQLLSQLKGEVSLHLVGHLKKGECRLLGFRRAASRRDPGLNC